MKRLSILVSGRVQGVGFRAFVEDVAEYAGVSGWVRNTMDGDVEIEAQGQEDQLELFERRIKEGPTLAFVRGYNANEIPVIDNEKEFRIRY